MRRMEVPEEAEADAWALRQQWKAVARICTCIRERSESVAVTRIETAGEQEEDGEEEGEGRNR